MRYFKSFAGIGLVAAALMALPATADAQSRGRSHGVPRGSVRAPRPPRVVTVVPYRNHYYRVYRPGVHFGLSYGYPGYYAPYAYAPFGYGAYGYGAYGYGPYAYGPAYGAYRGRPYGAVRIDVPQRDGEVYVDGYFLGIVDEFDGALQHANLEAGPHRVEVRAPGFETIAFDVNIEPGRTITYRSFMQPLQP